MKIRQRVSQIFDTVYGWMSIFSLDEFATCLYPLLTGGKTSKGWIHLCSWFIFPGKIQFKVNCCLDVRIEFEHARAANKFLSLLETRTTIKRKTDWTNGFNFFTNDESKKYTIQWMWHRVVVRTLDYHPKRHRFDSPHRPGCTSYLLSFSSRLQDSINSLEQL